ncbi:MAG: hypothetical protein ACRDZM_01215 [Acidimicrobiia bacterium]
MSNDVWTVSPRTSRGLVWAGITGLIASVAGLVLGLVLVDSVSEDLGDSVGLSASALLAIEETLGVVEMIAADVDEGLVAAADSIAAASQASATASGRLGDVADFLDGDLQTDIEALRGSMPAAIQAAGAIDDTLRALALFGVDYDPEQPFDVSLMAVEDALTELPSELSAQAESIRALVPASQQFSADASALAESFTDLGDDLAGSQEIIDSYRLTLDQAQRVVDDTGSSLTLNTWLLRFLAVSLALGGAALSLGLIRLGRALDAGAELPAHQAESEMASD